MCFSAGASFVAGTALSGIGIATLRTVRRREQVPFALIPLMFGIHQLVEGAVWWTMSHDAPVLQQAVTHTYSVFAHVFWPTYVPFALLAMERSPWRRRGLLVLQAIGIAVGLYMLYFIVSPPVTPRVTVLHATPHLLYVSPHLYGITASAMYVAATCLGFFLSRDRFLRLFGVLASVSFFIAWRFYTQAMISVWCFFAAVLSVAIYVNIRARGRG